MGHVSAGFAKMILAAAALTLPVAAWATTADDIAAGMHRGMNVLDDDPFWRDTGRERFQPRHFAVLHAAGFDTVRLNLHLMLHATADGAPNARELAALDRLVAAGLEAGQTVILDEHDDQICARDADDCRLRLRRMWSVLAPHFAGAPDRLLFEILNEPHGALTAPVWNSILREMLAVIRGSNPTRVVVIGPADMNSTSELPSLDLPPADRNILVTVHYYAPIRFTLQGASWVPSAKDSVGVEWGSDAEIAAMVRDFDRVRTWSENHHRPVFLGEFGVYEKAPMAARTRWLSRLARIAEAHGFPWAYWQMDTDFAAYDFSRQLWVQPILNALAPP